MEFASTTGVRSLFHYCIFHGDRFADVIERNRVYMSDTANFNDPWDCRPCFDFSQLGDPNYADRVIDWFYHAARKQTPHYSEEFHRARAVELRRNPDALRAAVIQASDMSAEIIKRYRVFCLTTHPTNILMWSHYAKNHSGICIEFSCHNFVFSGAFKVEYAQVYPPYHVFDGADERVLLPLVTKSSTWSYEDEYRLIAQERSAAFSESLLTDGNYLALPAGSIRSIILGCSTPPGVEHEIATILAGLGQNIALRRLVRVANRYDLVFA
jgi:hypothetical protein